MIDRQNIIDHFYIENGDCCAGCDWWRHINSVIGECIKSSPVSGPERSSIFGLLSNPCLNESGHPLTRRDHYCGDFKDSYDWDDLTAKRIKNANEQMKRKL